MHKLISCLLLTVLFVPAYAFAADNAKKAKGENILPRINPKKEGKVKSRDTDVAVKLTIRNRTGSAISLHWLDEDAGDRVHYKDIDAGAEIVQETWADHYWVILDKKEKPLGIYLTNDKDGVIAIENILPRINPKKEGKVKSKDTDVSVLLTIRNQAKSPISLHWLDEDAGDRVHYKDIKTGAEVDQETWEDHYWIILNNKGKALGIYLTTDEDGVVVIK